MENDVLYNRIMNVVHEEYGEGSTAVANPEGEPTDALEKIQIGDDVYSISGGGGGTDRFFEVHYDEDDGTLDKTWQEIFDAIEDGKLPFFVLVFNDEPISASFWECNVAEQGENDYSVHFHSVKVVSGAVSTGIFLFSTNSTNGYPALAD